MLIKGLTDQYQIIGYNAPTKFYRENDTVIQTLTFGRENEERVAAADTALASLSNETLFDNYYRDYINQIFDSRSKIYKFKARLPSGLASTIDLADTVIIGNHAYRFNSLSINVNNGDADLELYSIDNALFDISFGQSEDGLRVRTSIDNFITNITDGTYINSFPATFTVTLNDQLNPSFELIRNGLVVDTNTTGSFSTLIVEDNDEFFIRINDRGFTLVTDTITVTDIIASNIFTDHNDDPITDHNDDPITDNTI